MKWMWKTDWKLLLFFVHLKILHSEVNKTQNLADSTAIIKVMVFFSLSLINATKLFHYTSEITTEMKFFTLYISKKWNKIVKMKFNASQWKIF